MTLHSPDVEGGTQAYHPFPSPPVLARPEVSATLRKLGFGYRAEFIQKTAHMLTESHAPVQDSSDPTEPAEKWLMTLRALPTVQAREELLKLMGVGRKVADCVLLMSLDKVDWKIFSLFLSVLTKFLDGSGASRYPCTPNRCKALRYVWVVKSENRHDSEIVRRGEQ